MPNCAMRRCDPMLHHKYGASGILWPSLFTRLIPAYHECSGKLPLIKGEDFMGRADEKRLSRSLSAQLIVGFREHAQPNLKHYPSFLLTKEKRWCIMVVELRDIRNTCPKYREYRRWIPQWLDGPALHEKLSVMQEQDDLSRSQRQPGVPVQRSLRL